MEVTGYHGSISQGPLGSRTEAYLGVPLVLLICIFAWQHRRSRAAQVVVWSVVVAWIASLGGRLLITGTNTKIPLPLLPLLHLPVLRSTIPVRFALYYTLPAAVIVAMWLTARGGIRRWALFAAVVAFMAPNFGNAAWNTKIYDPPFIATGMYSTYLRASDRVLTVPPWGANERWQAETKFAFTLATGYAGVMPHSYVKFRIWRSLFNAQFGPNPGPQLRRFVAAKGVTAVVVDEQYVGLGFLHYWTTLFGTLGVRPLDVGGVLLYRLAP